MSLLYSITNLINSSTLLSTSSEDATYVMENLYNRRPSYPFRFTAKSGDIRVDLTASPPAMTLAAVFNHNLVGTGSGFLFALYYGNANPPVTGHYDFPMTADFNDSYYVFNQTYQYWMLDIDDAANPYNVEIGEFFLGNWSKFSSHVHLTPGRDDGPEFWMANKETHYGQDWTAYLSENEHFSLSFSNVQDPDVVDEIMQFTRDVMRSGGKFVFIPDDSQPWVYYVMIRNLRDFANRLFSGTRDLRNWSLELKTLTKGISLL